MSDQVNIGEYRLEISGDEVLVRDESGAVVDTVELDEVEGELTLPDGRRIDLAAVFSKADLNDFQTAAGPANDNAGDIPDGSGVFIPFDGTSGQFDRLESAGALDETSLGYEALAEIGYAANAFEPQQQARSSFDWSRHEADPTGNEPTHDPVGSHNQSGNKQSPSDIEGDDDEVVSLANVPSQLGPSSQGAPSNPQAGQQPPHDEGDDPIDPPADEQQSEDVNTAPTDIDLTGTRVVENVSGAIIGTLSVLDPDADDSHSFAVSDDRFEVVNGQLKLKDGVALDFEAAASVEVTVTATDNAGNQFAEIFTVGVTDVNEEPIVTSDGGSAHDYELYTSQLGKGQTTLDAGDDLLHIDTNSFSPVRMGDGYDTVHLAQQDRSFDHHDAIKLENVEAIDATGSGANKVLLSIHDVLNMTDSDNRLTIIGDEGDTVTLTGSGKNHWTVIESNADFTTYAYSDPSMQAVVEVSNQMNAQVS